MTTIWSRLSCLQHHTSSNSLLLLRSNSSSTYSLAQASSSLWEQLSIKTELKRTITRATTFWSRSSSNLKVTYSRQLLKSEISTVGMECQWRPWEACSNTQTASKSQRVQLREQHSRHKRTTCRRSELIMRHSARWMRAPRATVG